MTKSVPYFPSHPDHSILPNPLRILDRLRHETGPPSLTKEKRHGKQNQHPQIVHQRPRGTSPRTITKNRRHGNQGQGTTGNRPPDPQKQRRGPKTNQPDPKGVTLEITARPTSPKKVIDSSRLLQYSLAKAAYSNLQLWKARKAACFSSIRTKTNRKKTTTSPPPSHNDATSHYKYATPT